MAKHLRDDAISTTEWLKLALHIAVAALLVGTVLYGVARFEDSSVADAQPVEVLRDDGGVFVNSPRVQPRVKKSPVTGPSAQPEKTRSTSNRVVQPKPSAAPAAATKKTTTTVASKSRIVTD